MPKKLVVTILVLSISNIISCVSFWLSAYNYFPDILNLNNGLIFSISISFFIATLSISALICRKSTEFLLCSFPILVPTLLFARPISFSVISFLTIVIFGLLILREYLIEKKVYLKVSVFRLLKSNIASPFLLLALLASLAYYFTSKENLLAYQLKLPEELLEQSVNLGLKISGTENTSGIESNNPKTFESIKDAKNPVILSLLEKQGVTSKEEQAKIISEVEKFFPSNEVSPIAEKGGGSLSKTITESLKVEVENQLKKELDKYRVYFPFIFTLSFFLTITFIGPIIKLLAVIIGVVFFRLLESVGLLEIKNVVREGTELTFSE